MTLSKNAEDPAKCLIKFKYHITSAKRESNLRTLNKLHVSFLSFFRTI